MEIEEAVKAYLLTQTGLTSLIESKIFPDDLPQGTILPAISYHKVSDVKVHTLTGQNDLERPFFQFTVFSLTKAVARAVANQIKSALTDYSGTLSGIVIQKIELENEDADKNDGTDVTTNTLITVFTESLEFQINFERN